MSECEHKTATVLWNNESYQLLSCDWGCNGMLWGEYGHKLTRITSLPSPHQDEYDVLMDAFEIIAGGELEATNE